MYRAISDFLSAWKYESESTLKIFRNVTDESMKQLVAPGGRNLGFLAWHLTTTLQELLEHAGLTVDAPKPEAPVPLNMADIISAYEQGASNVAAQVKAAWSDAQLLDEIPMYGEKWTRGFTLSCLVAHQIHHRGQMTVLMRQAGLPVPGVYGPSKEEWAAAGMAAMP